MKEEHEQREEAKKSEWGGDYAALRVHNCRNCAPYLIGIRRRAKYFLVLFLETQLDLAILPTHLLTMARANSALRNLLFALEALHLFDCLRNLERLSNICLFLCKQQ